MIKDFIEWKGKQFPVRELRIPDEIGGFVAKVADIELFNAIEEDYYNEDKEAVAIDNSIYYYCNSGFIASDPTDREICDYLVGTLVVY